MDYWMMFPVIREVPAYKDTQDNIFQLDITLCKILDIYLVLKMVNPNSIYSGYWLEKKKRKESKTKHSFRFLTQILVLMLCETLGKLSEFFTTC